MTPIYYWLKLEYAKMALASGIPCVDTLSFQLSLHRLDDKRSRQTPFSFSWSEPFDLDFAGKPRSNPKRSRSLPNPVASKRKEGYPQGRDENQNNAIRLDAHGKAQRSVGIEKVGFRAYSQRNACTTANKLTSPLHEYANVSRHKESEDDTSDEELSAVAKKFRDSRESPTSHLSEVFAPQKFAGVAGFSGGRAEPRLRKRVSDESELTGYSSKRARPSVDFEKMLSSAVSFFKPIVHSESEDS